MLRNSICHCGSGRKYKHCHGRGKFLSLTDYTAAGDTQFHRPTIDPYSPAVTPIELVQGGQIFAHGTGFIWNYNNKQYLITNWHNLSGQNPFDSSHLNAGGRTPESIRFYPAKNEQNITRDQIEIFLYQTFHEPLWKQHGSFSKLRVDIAVLELSNPSQENLPTNYIALNRFDEPPTLFSHVGSDVFIVGYPFSEFDELLKFPIWKRGSLASEPLIGWKRRPVFLIDAASRPGMSGSPVIRKVFGPAPIPKDEGYSIQADNVMTQEFIGVYSGHLNAKSGDVTIGFAWYGKLIQEILEDPHPGSRL